jgi:hypothetical protein
MAGGCREGHRVMFRGRGQQCRALDGLLAEVRAGYSRVLVVRGEPGIGKTALLGYAARSAADSQVARAEGVESEMELPFAALHQLCGRIAWTGCPARSMRLWGWRSWPAAAWTPKRSPRCSVPAQGPGCWLGILRTRTLWSRAESSGMGNPPHAWAPAAVSGEDAEDAFRCLYAEHGLALLRLATTLTGGDRGRVEDLVQETMLRAWTHRNFLDMQHRPPRAWLITVARRLAVDAHRARRARPQEVQLEEHLATASGQWADGCIDEVGVRAAIATLPAPSS